jgi:hypothetical protein
VAVGALLAAYPVSEAGRLRELAVGAGALALVLLLSSLAFAWATGIAWVLVLLAGAYASVLAGRAGVDTAAPLYAGGLLVLAELAYWSVELRGRGSEERRVVVRRVTALAWLAIGSVVLGALVVAVTAIPLGGGVLWDAIGVAAAVGTLAVLAALARRQSHP